MPLILSKDGQDFVELESDFDTESGIDRNLQKAKNKGYAQYFDVISPKGEMVTVPESTYSAALEKGYTLKPYGSDSAAVTSPAPEKPTPGFGSKEFLSSAALQTAQTALPGSPTGLGAMVESAKSAFSPEGFQPPSKFAPEIREQVQSTIEASPEGKMAGQIAGTGLGAVGIMGATRAMKPISALGVDTAYQGAAGTAEALDQGAPLEESLEAGATRAASALVPTAAIKGAQVAGIGAAKLATKAGAKGSAWFAKLGIENPRQREAIEFLTGPEGKPSRDALYEKGLISNFDEVAKDFKVAQEQGLVKNLDEYYQTLQKEVVDIGASRDRLFQSVPDIPAPSDDSLVPRVRQFLGDRIPKETNTTQLSNALDGLESQVSPQYLLPSGQKLRGPMTKVSVASPIQGAPPRRMLQDRDGNKYDTEMISVEYPSLQQQVMAAQQFKQDVDDILPNLFVNDQSRFGRELKKIIHNDLRQFQRDRLSSVDPELAETFDAINAQFSAKYAPIQVLEKQARRNTGDVTEAGRFIPKASRPSLPRTKSTVSSDPESALSKVVPENMQGQFEDFSELQVNELRRALAEGRIKSAPSDLVEAAKGLRAKETVYQTPKETSAAEDAGSLSPLSRLSLLKRLPLKSAEKFARTTDRLENKTPIGDLVANPTGSVKERVMRTGQFATQGAAGQAFSDSEFRSEVPNEQLRADLRLLDQPLSKEGLTSLARKYKLPEEEVAQLLIKYAKGIE